MGEAALLYGFIVLYLAAAGPMVDRPGADSDLGGCQRADRLAPPAAPDEPGDDGEIERVP
jgi:hypothetical protein